MLPVWKTLNMNKYTLYLLLYNKYTLLFKSLGSVKVFAHWVWHCHMRFLGGNACYGCENGCEKCMLRMRKCRKSNLIWIFFWRTKVSEPWNVIDITWGRIYFFTWIFGRKFQTQCAMTFRFVLCKEMYTSIEQGCIKLKVTLKSSKL